MLSCCATLRSLVILGSPLILASLLTLYKRVFAAARTGVLVGPDHARMSGNDRP